MINAGIWISLLWFTAGCGDDNGGKDGDGEECTVGESEICECEDGQSSIRVCLDDGTFTECACSHLSCTTPGVQIECDCESGATGTRVCRTDGTLSDCICPTELPRCCHDLGACISRDMVPQNEAEQLGKDTCQDKGLLCVPDQFMDPGGVTLTTCHAVGGGEGRCLPDCLPDIAAQKDELDRDICPRHHLCAPCYDPFTGYWTGSCGLFGDQAVEFPVKFERCCKDKGYCVSADQIPEDQTAFLGEDTCPSGTGKLCVPEVFLNPDNFTAETCRSIGDNEGRCLPDCLPDVADQPVSFPQDICQEDFSCAPCFDPFTGELTGSCELFDDPGPQAEPIQFEPCCEDRGHCVPADLVPEDQVSFFSEDTCPPGHDLVCVPDVLTQAGGFVPDRCRSVGFSEGRCLPDCLPEVQAQPVDLPRDSCDEHFACVPCFDPFDGSPTGACELPGDESREQPTIFPRCCDGAGFCVPGEVIPEDEAECLYEDTCSPGQGLLCTPEVLTRPEGYTPKYCRSISDIEGRCLPECVPDITNLAISLPRDICEEHFVCAPFYDPLDGEVAGTCDFPGDRKPTEDPVVFEKCCRVSGIDHGTCIPDEALPPDYQGVLDRDTCPSSRDACVPDNLIPDPDIRVRSCMAVVPIEIIPGAPLSVQLEGGCVAECIVPPDMNTLIERETCGPGEKCLACLVLEGIIPNACGSTGI